jgi:hypothetical protein
MYYLYNPTTKQIAACESAESRDRLLRRGYVVVTPAAHRTLWQRQDQARKVERC